MVLEENNIYGLGCKPETSAFILHNREVKYNNLHAR